MSAQDLSPADLASLSEEKKDIILSMGVECGRISATDRKEYYSVDAEAQLSILFKAVHGEPSSDIPPIVFEFTPQRVGN